MRRWSNSFARSRVPVRQRIRLDSPVFRSWLLVVLVSGLTVVAVSHTFERAEAEKKRWGDTAEVLVVTRSVERGASLDEATELREIPVALLPRGALHELGGQRRARHPLVPGQVLTDTAAPTFPGDRNDVHRIAIAVDEVQPKLEPGQLVDVWATFDSSLTEGRPSTRRVAQGAEVSKHNKVSVVLFVETAEVSDIAEASALATIAVVALE